MSVCLKVVRKETGNCYETMYRNVTDFIGKQARVRLVDESSTGWGDTSTLMTSKAI